MEILPIDLVALVSTILGISIVLVPVVGLTARFALKPVVEALGRFSEDRTVTETVQILRQRVDLQEREIEALQTTLRRLEETSDFDRQLRETGGHPRLTPAAGEPDIGGES